MANILIIDDDQDFSRAFQRIIERMGHPCQIARNIKDAFALLTSMHCDLIFLDVNLPDGNGLAHIKQFQTFPSLPEVVILTGDADEVPAALASMPVAYSSTKACVPILRSSENANAQKVKALNSKCARSACRKALDSSVAYSCRRNSQ